MTAVLLESTIKASVVLAAGLAAAALLRRRSAALRHWVLAASVACAIAMPLLQAAVPDWRVPAMSALVGRRLAPLVLLVPVPYAALDAPAAESAAAPLAASLARFILPIWIAGVGLSLAILAIGLARLGWLARRARPIHDALLPLVADALGLAGPVLLLESEAPLLVTWGFPRPKILLPSAARDWTASRRRVVLAHELAHVARRDWIVQLAGELLRALQWFNPLAWIACRRLRLESERACDDLVLALGVDGSEYATHLLDLARDSAGRARTWLPAPAMARPSSLERRVRAMLNVHVNRCPIGRTTAIAALGALACVAVPLAGFGASPQPAASFAGSLVDAIGRILPSVPLSLTNAATHQRIDVQSDPQGHFLFAGLQAGDYLLVAQKPGFTTEPARVVMHDGEQRHQDVALQLGTVVETVRVSAVPPAQPLPPRPPRRPALSWADHTAAEACMQASIGGCIEAPLKLTDVKPVYPPSLEANGVGGAVELTGRIGADGFVHGLRVVGQADPDLAKAAIDAVSQWAFRPTFLDGVPVEVGIQAHVAFVAQ